MLQHRFHAAFTLPRRHIQDLQILLDRALRLLLDQHVIGQAEPARWKHLLPIAIVRKGARLPYQPVNDVPVCDPALPPTAQPWQRFHPLLRVPDFEMVGMDPHLDPLTNHAARYRVGVAVHMDRTAPIDADTDPLPRVEPARRQGPQHRQLFEQALLPTAIQLHEQLPHKGGIVGATGEIPMPPQQQRLIERPLELMMALFHIAIFVRLRRINRLPLQSVILQQFLIPLLKRRPVTARRHRRGQRIGAMDLGDAAQLSQGVLQPVAQALITLRKANRPRLPVRVGQHKMINQMRKGVPRDRDAQLRAVREVRGAQPARDMHLCKEHLLRRSL